MDERRRALTENELARLRQALDPAARSLRATPLLGGLDTGTYALELTDADGDVRRLVLRRYDSPDGEEVAAQARRHWAILQALRGLPLLMPDPVLFDTVALGAPAMVTTRLDGAPLAHPADTALWLDELAATLARIHATELSRLPPDFPRTTQPAEDLLDAVPRHTPEQPDPLWNEVVAALRRRAGRVRPNPPALLHRDLWFGNTLWVNGLINGVIDWFGARIGDPAGDVGYVRGDAALVLGGDAPERLLQSYERRRGRLEGVAYWDLHSVLPGFRWLPRWVDAYQEVGLTELTLSLARERLEAFVTSALARLARDA